MTQAKTGGKPKKDSTKIRTMECPIKLIKGKKDSGGIYKNIASKLSIIFIIIIYIYNPLFSLSFPYKTRT
jgi:hypothetical protein